jgi:hypothetical protein
MLKKINKIILFFCLPLLSYTSFGQNNTNSPYSMFGIGDLLNNGYGRSSAMGGVSTSLYSMHSLNPSNPASYSSITPSTFIFEVGLAGNRYTLKSQEKSFKKFDGNIRSIALGFPITNWWKSGIGITPLSSIGYNIEQKNQVDKDTTYNFLIYNGQGGVNSFYIDNSFQIFKSFSIGAKVSYLFGSLDRNRTIVNQNISSSTTFEESNRWIFNKFSLGLGAHFHKAISEKFVLNIGANYSFKTDLSTDYAKLSTLKVDNSSGRVDLVDTLHNELVKSNLSIPISYSLGISSILFQKVELAFDYQKDKWSETKFEEQVFSDNKRYSFGLEYIPDGGSSVYWKLVRYRAGLSLINSYLLYNNTQLKQSSGSFGLGLPLRSGALINIGFIYSHREAPNVDILKENYFQLNLNFSFKANWFIKKHFY